MTKPTTNTGKRDMNRSPGTLRRLAGVGLSLLAGVLLLAAASPEPTEVDPVAALNEGNRLFRGGEIESAIAAYRAGYSPRETNPTLLYNLGTALHHADRLPEAILWYRRAEGSDDPWLADNLWLARRALGSQALAPAGSLGWLVRHGGTLRVVAVALVWLALVLLIAIPRAPWWGLASAGALALVLYGSAVAGQRWGPRPAVLLEDCPTTGGAIPAGTEAWVRRADQDQWLVATAGPGPVTCPADAIEPIFPG